ncbi:DUF7009 family protein [Adhaeribacter pallidiroseus]|uniref:Uncharacterized protein n=1 Tax=Adhaeribacter pallidiroseus TaxID=2072847 RepID=A0A369Q9X4_9BACT|nr:hypothetical protein [Adhaeribacter pallidiroseus]RDC61494.1 hypothetical protein AHMF7616_00073 [Adhaeribacter pallidiroseus]
MKLRIQGNSLRLRLSEAEVIQFADTGQVAETILFSPDETNALRYILQQTSGKEVSVRFSDNVITISIPELMAQKWTDTDLIGFDDLIDLGNEKQLRIVVEKDLECRH